MDLSRKLIYTCIISATLICSEVIARSNLPVLATKQLIKNLRLITRDGKVTYYQQNTGGLFLSTNYSVIPILKGEYGTNYKLISTHLKKKLLIEQNVFNNNLLGIMNLKNIHVSDFAKKATIKLGTGINAQLHLNESWASFYNPHLKTIHLKNLEKLAINFTLIINNKISPYFIPTVIFLDKKNIIFTDINKEGMPGIIQYARESKSMTPIHKADSSNAKLELCKTNDYLFIGYFGITTINPVGSWIWKVPLKQFNIKDKVEIYHSSKNDIGNIICSTDNSIHFSKDLTTITNKERHEIVSLNLKDNKIKILSDLNYATHVIDMDKKLLIPFRGKYYVLRGKDNLSKDVFHQKINISFPDQSND